MGVVDKSKIQNGVAHGTSPLTSGYDTGSIPADIGTIEMSPLSFYQYRDTRNVTLIFLSVITWWRIT